MKKIIILISFALAVSSCKKDFLDENTRSVASEDSFYGTSNGLEKLITACYVSNKMWYGKEEGFDFSDVGTDIYTYGQQTPNKGQFVFDNTFNSFNGRITILWVEIYRAVNACNQALVFVDDASHPMSKTLREKRKAEVLFLRAHYFWLLTETWGNVPMPLTPTNGPITKATRTAVKDIYKQIIADLNKSHETFLPADNAGDADFGRVNKDAVTAFRARINLTMASYIKHAGNPNGLEGSADTYYQNAKADADALINSGKYNFYSSYALLWDFNNNSNKRNQEGIWAVNYSRGTYAPLNVNLSEYTQYFLSGQKAYDEREGGHHGHMMWATQYDAGTLGLTRDLTYGRPFRRYCPNKYLIDAFNSDLDARFDGQFRTAWIANGGTATIPKWGDFNLPADYVIPGGKTLTDPIFNVGDTALVITNKDIPDNRVAPNKVPGAAAKYISLDGHYILWDYNTLFNTTDNTIRVETDHNFFIPLKKFEDPFRTAANGLGSQNGARDAYAFRIAEMYLIATEAATELGGGGLSYLITLADSRSKTANGGAALLASYGIAGDADITVDKILDERAREFPGEQLRWFDLKRFYSPSAFVDRIKKYNFDAVGLKTTHYFRPIPQTQLDAIENAAEFGQNPGY